MDALIQYAIPVKGLRNGLHRYEFHIDRLFFVNFEGSPVEDSEIDLELSLDKRPDMLVLEFDFEGTVRTECDRCLAEINLPVSGNARLLVKYSLEEEPEEVEVVYIHPETDHFNVAKYIYEYIVLSMPMIKVYDCEAEDPRPCNEEMLRYLASSSDPAQAPGEEENPIWDELKKLKNDN